MIIPNHILLNIPTEKPCKICKTCLQFVGKGIYHPSPCGIRHRRAVSTLVKEKVAESPSGSSYIQVATASSKDLKIPVPINARPKKALYPDQPIPASQVFELQTAVNLSLNKVKKVLKRFRVQKG